MNKSQKKNRCLFVAKSCHVLFLCDIHRKSSLFPRTCNDIGYPTTSILVFFLSSLCVEKLRACNDIGYPITSILVFFLSSLCVEKLRACNDIGYPTTSILVFFLSSLCVEKLRACNDIGCPTTSVLVFLSFFTLCGETPYM